MHMDKVFLLTKMKRINMNKKILALSVTATLGLSACSSFKTSPDVTSGKPISPGAQVAISEQRLENNYKRQGIKVIYTLLGDLEAIEATGYAPVWGNSENAAREAYRVAELEAKKSVNDFINQENIRTTTSVEMFSRNLERAFDNKNNNIATNQGRDTVSSTMTDDEVPSTNRDDNRAQRQDAVEISSKVRNNIVINNRGILGGMYLVEGEVINSGRTVRVVYRWDKKHNSIRPDVRRLMAQ